MSVILRATNEGLHGLSVNPMLHIRVMDTKNVLAINIFRVRKQRA